MFNLRIVQLREKHNLTQVKLARILNISPSTIAMWESDHRIPPAPLLCKIADYFNVSLDYLLGREEKATTGYILSESEQLLIDFYRGCNVAEQGRILGYAQSIIDTKKK